MTLLLLEGFEVSKHVTTVARKWNDTNLPNATFIANPVNASLSMLNFGGIGHIESYPFANSSTIIVGFRYINATPYTSANWDVLQIKKGASIQVRLRARPGTNGTSTKFELVRGGTTNTDGTVLASSADFTALTPLYCELKVTINDTTGSFDFHVGEVSQFSGTGVNTENVGDGSHVCNTIKFQNWSSAGQCAIDDIYVLDTTGSAPQNTFLGDCIVEGITVSGDGATNNFPTIFPASPTTHFDKVDDPVNAAPNDSTDYVLSNNDGQKELYAMTDLAVITGNIYGLLADAYVKLTNTGSRNLHHTYRQGTGGSSGTEADGSTIALTQTGFDPPITQVWQINPVTSAAWTVADINAAQFGIETG